MSNYSMTDYTFNGNVSQPANAALGIFSAQSYGSLAQPYGTGGDDTAAIQAALNAAAAVKGVAFLPPPRSGTLNISAPLVMNAGVSLVGASPTVSITVIPGSNLNWVISPLTAAASDPFTVCAIGYRAIMLGGNTYDTFNPAAATSLASQGSIVNVRFIADTNNTTGRGWGVMLNAVNGFTLNSVSFNGFTEAVSVWDSYKTQIRQVKVANGTAAICIHRGCYDTSISSCEAYSETAIPYRVYNESFVFAGPVTVPFAPMYTKFVDNHAYGTTAYGYDLQGAAYINLTSTTAEVTAGVYQAITRNGVPCFGILTDTAGSSGVTSVAVTAPIQNTGSSTAPNIGIAPAGTNGYVLTTVGGVAVWAAAAAGGVTGVTASSPLASSGGTTPNLTLGTVPASSGGTGLTAPGASGNVLTSNGSAWTSTAPSGGGSYPIPRQTASGIPITTASTTVTLPYTAKSGSVIVAFGCYSGTTFPTPTGWTQLGNANGLAVYYRTATGTSADQFIMAPASGTLSANFLVQEFTSGGTPYGFNTVSTGGYQYYSPLLTTTGQAMVIAFWQGHQNSTMVGAAGWSYGFLAGSDFQDSRALGVASTIIPATGVDASFGWLYDDPTARYCAIVAIP